MSSYALRRLTSILGPARRVTAMSGVCVPFRTWQGHEVPAEVDDNTLLLLDFGRARFALVRGTAAGRTNPQFAASTFYGMKGVLDGVLLNDRPIEFDGRDRTLDAPITDCEALVRTLPHVVGRHRDIPESHAFGDAMQPLRRVRDGVASLATKGHARHVIGIIGAGYAPVRAGRAMELQTTFDLPD